MARPVPLIVDHRNQDVLATAGLEFVERRHQVLPLGDVITPFASLPKPCLRRFRQQPKGLRLEATVRFFIGLSMTSPFMICLTYKNSDRSVMMFTHDKYLLDPGRVK